MSTESKGLKIIALQAENLKRLVAIEIRPDGHMVELTGKNGQGKTSVLDAIWWALEGTSHIQAAPIRKGATEAIVRLDLGEIKVTRKFRAKEEGGFTTSIVVENAEGARYPSPQAMLDALVGELSFDPLAFTRMRPADQLETLKSFVPDVDFKAIDDANRADFAERTAVNRRAKELRAQAAGIDAPAEALATIDEAALVAELERAGQHNADLEQRKGRRVAAAESCDRDEAEAKKLRDQVADLIDQAEQHESRAKALREQIAKADALPEPIDTTEVRQRIASAREHNHKAALASQKAAIEAQAVEQETKSNALSDAMDKREADKRAAIANAKLPIDGVTFGDGQILLNDIPFDQASDAQRLQASIAIAAAMNPKLRVIRVRDGSLLDEDAMKLLAAFAEQHDLQIWIERVDGTGRVGFVLEDGHVRNAAAAPATSEAA